MRILVRKDCAWALPLAGRTQVGGLTILRVENYRRLRRRPDALFRHRQPAGWPAVLIDTGVRRFDSKRVRDRYEVQNAGQSIQHRRGYEILVFRRERRGEPNVHGNGLIGNRRSRSKAMHEGLSGPVVCGLADIHRLTCELLDNVRGTGEVLDSGLRERELVDRSFGEGGRHRGVADP